MTASLEIRYLATAERDLDDIFYIVKNESIQIRRILHGARQYSFLF